jgi:glutathione S-transferase
MSITFYYSPQSSATRIHWALEELGLAYEKVKLDLRAGDQKKPDFLKINPNGKVPALVVDGVTMFESLAILIHLGERHGVDRGLWPREGTSERAEALTWIVWGSVSLAAEVFKIFMNTSDWTPAESHNAMQADMARQEFHNLLKILDARLHGREYIVGDTFTFADLGNASLLGWATGMLKTDMSQYPAVAAWLGRCTGRPAFRVAFAG